MEPEESGDLLRRACDPCRLRKIRCDRQVPCSNCSATKLRCVSTGAGQKPKEARQRVLISAQYERKIDHIEHRLGDLTASLRTISQSQQQIQQFILSKAPGLGESSPSASSQTLVALRSGNAVSASYQGGGAPFRMDRSPNDPTFEGHSSVAAHASFASKILEHAVEHSSPQDAKPRLRTALSSLQQLLHMKQPVGGTDFRHQKPVGNGGLRDLPMPPLDAVVGILRELKEKKSLMFTLICGLTSVDYFTEKCRQIYFATEDFNQATFLIANAGLFYLLQEKTALAMHAGDKEAAIRHKAHSYLCRDNIETVLANLNLLMPAKKENAEALVLGASYAIEISKPYVAWQLNAAACQICLAMGYHRAAHLPGESHDAKSKRAVLFWLAYILDKALALRLGRPSILQDYDITLPRKLEPFGDFDGHREMIQSWLLHAEVQGRIYEELFSPAGLMRSAEHRLETARSCAELLINEVDRLQDMRQLLERSLEDDTQRDGNDDIAGLLLRSDELSLLATVTLIYRTIPPELADAPPRASTSFCRDCVEVARRAMQMHSECAELLKASPTLAPAYMHWTILFSPFIPFIILFCHVIEGSGGRDLEHIETFMTSLESWRQLSDYVDRLFRLSRMLYDVAVAYVEAREVQEPNGLHHESNQVEMIDPSVTDEFDTCLNQLGLLPGEEANMGSVNGANSGSHSAAIGQADSQGGQFGDWFLGYVNGGG